MPTDSRSLDARSTVRFANGTEVAAPFAGQAVQWAAAPGSLRASRLPAEEEPAWLVDALTDPDLGIREQETVQVDVAAPQAVAGRLRGAPQEDTVRLRPAPPPPGMVQVTLYQDEAGGMSWHLPDGLLASGAGGARAASAVRMRGPAAGATFTIPARTVEAQTALRSVSPSPASSARMRSTATKLGRKLFRVLLLPVLGPVIEKPLEAIVGRIERKLRQTLIRPLAPDNYNSHVETPFTDWDSLRGKRSLLVVHGILSNTEGVLSLLKRQPVERWQAHYGGRMIAYDHLTITQSPEDNVRFFLQELARAGGPFEFDVLCHSRGGIVSRTLAERGRQLVPEAQCDVKNVFFVAAPNQGSTLGDAGHTVEMLDVFTSLVNLLPNGPVLYSIEILLAIVKLLAYGLEQLPGVITMGTKGYIPDVLNRGGERSPAAYAAAAANYEPKPGDLLFSIADAVLDRVFTEDGRAITNDLIVPTDGVFAANGHPSFPIADPLVYQPGDALWHTELFGQDRTIERIERHFGIAGGPVALAPPSMAIAAPAAAPPEAPPRRRPRMRGPVHDPAATAVAPPPPPPAPIAPLPPGGRAGFGPRSRRGAPPRSVPRLPRAGAGRRGERSGDPPGGDAGRRQ